MTPRLRWGAASDIGLVREVNEDSMLHEPPLFAVADGMGGHLAGDVASGIAIETLTKTGIRNAGTLPEAVREANRAIFEKASSDEGLSGMGTTIIAMFAEDDSAQIVHVGDCRAYLLRDGQLSRLTQDHTVVERLVKEGRILAEDADRHPQRSYLERALGVDPQVEVDVKAMDTKPGDRFLLCSDGLFGMIDDDRILEILTSEPDPKEAAERLCKQAVEAGGRDNVTVIVIDYQGAESEPAAEVSFGHEAGAAVSSKAVPVRSHGTAEDAGRAGRAEPPRRAGRIALFVLVGLLLLTVAGVIAVLALRNAWYVGISGGKVAVFQGVSGSVAGFSLSTESSVSDLDADRLPNLYRRRLSEGIPADSRSDARSIIRNLKLQAEPAEPPPSPAPPELPPPPPVGTDPAAPPSAALPSTPPGGDAF